MRNLPLEVLGEWLTLGLYSALTAVFTAAGLFLELLGFEHLAAGELGLGIWLVYFGLLGIVTGTYLFGYTELLPRLRGSVGSDGS